MGFFDRFKKENKAAAKGRTDRTTEKKRKEQEKQRKAKEEEVKRRQFMAVGTAAPEKTKEEGKTPEKVAAKKKPQKFDTKQAPRLLIKPIVSEKATALGVNNQYLFAVAVEANKIEIKKAIKNLYGFTPFKVNIVKVAGKKVRYGATSGRTKKWKKAIITLSPGQKIDVSAA